MDARLGRACRDARNRAGLRLLDISPVVGVSESTLSRFERGALKRWPPRTNAIVDAYASRCMVDALDLWRAALDIEEEPPDPG